MGLLPWDNWIYHLSDKRDQVNGLHSRAVALQSQVQSQIVTFNRDLGNYKNLIAANQALLLIANTIKMSDLKFKEFQEEISAMPTPVTGSIPLQMGELITELVGGAYLTKGLFQFGKLVKNGFTSDVEVGGEDGGDLAIELTSVGEEAGIAGGEGAAEIGGETVGEEIGELAAETAIEGSSMGALASTGIGIFAAVGIDLIFGAIDGARERDELDKQINKLETALNKVQCYYNTIMAKQSRINAGIVNEEKRFAPLCHELQNIAQEGPTFDYHFDATVANYPSFAAAQHMALSQYGAFMKLRNMWDSYAKKQIANDQQPSKTIFLQMVEMFAPKDMTDKVAEECFRVLANNSDGMKQYINT